MLAPLPSIQGVRSQLDRAVGFRDAIGSKLDAAQTEVKDLEARDELLNLTSQLIRVMIDREVTEAVQAVERLVTEGLQTVFDDQNIRLRTVVEESRGKVSVSLVTVEAKDSGIEIEGAGNDSFGGSVVTVQSVIMRVIVMLRRGLRPLLFLDESLVAFDANYIGNMAQFLSALCDRLGLNIVLVTHNPMLVDAANKVYRTKQVKGVTSLVEVR